MSISLFKVKTSNWLAAVPKKGIAGGMVLAVGLVLGVANASGTPQVNNTSDLVETGKYLAAAGNCVSCHTVENGDKFAGGLAFDTPFGMVYSTNITSDPEYGIGSWSLEEFEKAMRHGERPDGENLYPVFPYQSFTLMSDDDIAALYAYMKTVEPVQYTPPENDLGFPYNQRWAVGIWKSMYFEEGRFEPKADQSEQWNRGAYLVEGLGHCGMCHSPRNALGAIDADLVMTGGVNKSNIGGKVLDWSAPNLTSDDTGLAMWREEDLRDYLKLGVSERAGVFGPMNKVVMNSTRHLSLDDVTAMAVYLKSLPANSQDMPAPADDKTKRAGSIQYDIHCGTCHLPTGKGHKDTGPPLLGSPVVLDSDPSTLINVTLFGPEIPKTAPSAEWVSSSWQHMKPFAAKLNDKQTADLLSFIRSAWGHKAGAVSEEQVAKQRY